MGSHGGRDRCRVVPGPAQSQPWAGPGRCRRKAGRGRVRDGRLPRPAGGVDRGPACADSRHARAGGPGRRRLHDGPAPLGARVPRTAHVSHRGTHVLPRAVQRATVAALAGGMGHRGGGTLLCRYPPRRLHPGLRVLHGQHRAQRPDPASGDGHGGVVDRQRVHPPRACEPELLAAIATDPAGDRTTAPVGATGTTSTPVAAASGQTPVPRH